MVIAYAPPLTPITNLINHVQHPQLIPFVLLEDVLSVILITPNAKYAVLNTL